MANLGQMMLEVIREVQAKRFQLQDDEGRWCRLRTNPYRTMDNRIEGVVLSVGDVDGFPKHGSKRSKQKGVSTAKYSHKKE